MPLETQRQDGIPTKRQVKARPLPLDTQQTNSHAHRTRLVENVKGLQNPEGMVQG